MPSPLDVHLSGQRKTACRLLLELLGHFFHDRKATVLIYNNENKVAKFVQDITDYASENQVYVVAFSPKTQGEELLNKIFNFFDKVEKK